MTSWLVDFMSREMERRRLLTRAARAGFAAALGVTGVAINETSALAACNYWCNNWQTNRSVYCCDLGYYNTCGDFSCFSGDCVHNWWVWTCCWNRYLVYCYECCDWQCSKTAAYEQIPCVGSTTRPPKAPMIAV